MNSILPKIRIRLPLAITVVVITAAIIGLAAANIVPQTAGGQGTNTISGYTVGAVTYGTDSQNPPDITQVQFTLTGSPAPTVVQARVRTSDPYSANCTNPSSTTWVCVPKDSDGNLVTMFSAGTLDVLATQ